ncbi:MAG: protocatechuate 3,4-dioxygenase [Gammaproteobacteria bacterium CG11_big_fil_rev_8_21_14_0_20_46_22]|nr:MAG: protocatechuate 3,4-dioxygenase [Gammaproteobacteria bacterium CG12_big_fil_rev_8_21_14_0_65_46_12]PIR11431.1 MAG: protocatechuate 3,4-dioxygenase [Gammaproteobacteria bacterium CG11_big_fil_rev_8_21_14_0_20_46_22]
MDAKTFTDRVLKQYQQFDDPRAQAITESLIKHLHGFIADTQLTNQEWEMMWEALMDAAKFSAKTNRNEFLLFADVLGISQLVEVANSHRPNNAVGSALVGPYYRANAPMRKLGDAIMSDDTEGERVNIRGTVRDSKGQGLAGAKLDVWQAATNGLYDIQDPKQPRMNLRGRFIADENGEYHFTALIPTPYPVPTDGPVGVFLAAANRQVYRPAHIHFIVTAPEHETLVTQVFSEGDPLIEQDVVFTADKNMIGDFKRNGDHYELQYDFELLDGESIYPEAPIKD